MFEPHRLRAIFAALILGFSAAHAPVQAQESAPADCQGPASSTWIKVSVTGVRNSNGLVAVTLYADVPGKFLVRHGSLYTGRFPAREGTTQACLFVPKPGVYAIAVYHDENSSRKLDRTALGLPAEAFGFSNNPSTFLGIPSFAKVRLSVPRTDLGTQIGLRYP